MRIGSQSSIQQVKTNLSRPAERLGILYGQLTSGRRLARPSDDPVAAARVVQGQAALDELGSRKFVLQMGKQLIGAADSALGEIYGSLSRCKDLVLQGVAPTLQPDERRAMANEIRSLASSMVTAANTRVQGQYIFAGSQTNTMPFEADEDANLPVLYHGNHQQVIYTLTQTDTAPAGLTGSEIFNYPDATGTRPIDGVDQDVFSLLSDLADAVERGDVNAVTELSPDLEATYSHIVGLRGQTGVIAQRYERALNVADDTEVRVKELLSVDRDVDYASAISDLSREQTVYQAALSMTSRLLEMPDLFDLPW